jgi:uncharacterized protein (TIGR02246 family)
VATTQSRCSRPRRGAPANPDWYQNLLAHPFVVAEIGTDRSRRRARVAAGAERERLLAEQKGVQPVFADYETKTARPTPVVVLEPLSADETAIAEVVEELDRTQSDVDAFTRLLHDDVTVVNISGRRVSGRDAFRSAMESARAGSLSQVLTSTRLVAIQSVRPDVALAHCTKTVSGERNDPTGNVPSSGVLTFVVARYDRQWLIVLAQTTAVAEYAERWSEG